MPTTWKPTRRDFVKPLKRAPRVDTPKPRPGALQLQLGAPDTRHTAPPCRPSWSRTFRGPTSKDLPPPAQLERSPPGPSGGH